MLAERLHDYIGKEISFTWSDGWDDYPYRGVLESVELDTGGNDPRYPMLSMRLSDHGPVLLWPDDEVQDFEVLP